MNDTIIFDVIVIGAGHAGAAAAYRLQKEGLHFLMLEKGRSVGTTRTTRYDSLVLTHSSHFAELPGLDFGPSSSFFPPRDEFINYVERYYATFGFPVRYNQTVTQVQKTNKKLFTITTATGEHYHTRSIIAASGGCNQPRIPEIPGLASFSGTVLHTSSYKEPSPYKGKKIAIIGGGLSGLQIGYELSARSDVQLITRNPIPRVPQYIFGKEIVYRTNLLGIDASPIDSRKAGVPDDGKYKKALHTGRITHHLRSSYSIEHGVFRNNSHTQSFHPDVILLATGYRTTMPYLSSIPGATTGTHEPIHRKGISLTDPHLCFVGLPGQRTFSSGNIRGASRDAQKIVSHLTHTLNKKL